MRSTWTRLLALLLALTLVAAACGDDDDDDAAAPDGGGGDTEQPDEGERCDETVAGSQLDYGVFAPTSSLDPPYVSGALVGGTEIANVYDVLMTFDPETNQYEPKLAESLEPNDDDTVWTLKLRDDVTYSDGTPLNAQLVADNMDRYLQQGVRNTSGGFLTVVESKEVIDEVTLEVTLKQPWAEFPFVFADEPGMIVNLNAIGDDPEAFGAQPPDAAGVGPYVVERNVPGEELVLKARQDYWDGPVCIERLRFVFVPGAQASYDAFRSGELDVAFLRESSVIASARANDENEYFAQQDAGAVLMINHAEGRPGADPKVREAIALAIDPEVINNRAYNGDLKVHKSLVGDGSRFYSDAIEELAVDAEGARAALDEAKGNGYDGQLTVLCSNAPPAPETALSTEALLEAVGFDVTVETKPTADQIGQIITGDFDVACWGFNADASTSPTTYLRNLKTGSSSNRMKYSSPEMDAAVDEVLAAADEEARQEAVAEVNEIFHRDFVSVNYGSPEEGIVWTDEVRGIRPTVATIFLFDKAYLDG